MATSYQTADALSSSTLVGQTGRFAGQEYQLLRPSLIVGRGGDCDLVFDDPKISRHHARLSWQAEHWFVEDLGSTNGTLVNGIPVTGHGYLLNPGGLLSLGGIIFQLQTSALKDTLVAPPPRSQANPPLFSAAGPSQPYAASQAHVPVSGGTSSCLAYSGASILIVGLILLALVGVAAWLLFSSLRPQVGTLQARIDSPVNGTEVAEGETLTVVASASDKQSVSRLEIWIDGALAQAMAGTSPTLAVTHPWTAHAPGSHAILARVYNVAGQTSDAVVTITVIAAGEARPSIEPGQPAATEAGGEVIVPSLTTLPDGSAGETPLPTLTPQPTYTPQATYTPGPQAAPLGVFNDFEVPTTWRRGDQPNGTFEQSSAEAHSGSYAGRLDYNFPSGGNDFVVFLWSQALDGDPNQINLWVRGDGSGHLLNVWIKDSAGETWQFPFGPVRHTGWRQMSAYLDTNQPWPTGHIAGPDNGVVDYPVSFQALVLDDAPDSYRGSGTIYVDDLESVRGSGLPLPTPTVTASPTVPPVATSIDFRADRTTLNVGQCTTLRWDVEHVREVYLDGEGVAGHATRQVCPSTTRTYVLHVVLPDGAATDRELTISVTNSSGSPPAAPSNLSIAIAMQDGFGLTFKDNSAGAADGFRLYNADSITLMREYPAAAAPNLPISGLACGTTYRMALTAFNASGESGPSNLVQGTTQSCP
jgi:pSer/pThr/pTyr-binding forkhead associated (FHA) protein